MSKFTLERKGKCHFPQEKRGNGESFGAAPRRIKVNPSVIVNWPRLTFFVQVFKQH